MANNVHLTPDLEAFARTCVASGRYNNVSEVVRSGLRLLQEAETRRALLHNSLVEAEAEADRDGTHEIVDVMAEADAVIARRG